MQTTGSKRSESDSATAKGVAAESPLCVDLDGTLIGTDLLWEALIIAARTKPWVLLLVPFWLLRGKTYLKSRIAEIATPHFALLPVRGEVLQFLREEHARGRAIVLVTASVQPWADAFSAHLGIFSAAYGTRDKNLRGKAKAAFLSDLFGAGGFDYMGDSRSDLPVWKAARKAHVVGPKELSRKVSTGKLERVFPTERASLVTWVKALRGHHWSKNLLIFVPLLLAHHFVWQSILNTTLAFILFGVCASSLYVLNDLLDLHSDRGHPWKSERPFASCRIPIANGVLLTSVLIPSTLALAYMLSPPLAAVLVLYAALTLIYSGTIKQIPMLDVFVLTSFYLIRLWVGALAGGVALSQWFLGFSLFFFLGLAMSKRYSELFCAAELVDSKQSGRGYVRSDAGLLMIFGVTSCFASILTLSLYVHSPEVMVLYRHPDRLMLLCPILLYWCSRLWLRAQRGELTEDPVSMALRDPSSYVIGLLSLAIIISSTLHLR